MKKILSLLLAFSLALSLAACGGSASSAVSSAAVSPRAMRRMSASSGGRPSAAHTPETCLSSFRIFDYPT